MSDIDKFLTLLFEFKADDHYILIWTLRDHRSAWFADLNRAIRFVEEKQDQDVYVGVGLAGSDLGRMNRAAENQIVALTGFCVDADYANGVHKKSNLPPETNALQMLREMPLPPTVITSTGHGYHGWWLFKEPWAIETAEEQAELKWLSWAWGKIYRDKAEAQGWTADSVFDLARVMRVPGTMNCKEATHVRATIVETNDWRAGDLDAFYEFLPEPDPSFLLPATEIAKTVGNGLTLSPDAEPPAEKLQILLANDPKFAKTHARKRRDLSDDSPSGYDMSLAWYACMADWTDQEIADLLISCRRAAGDDLKLRTDYYARTIANARESVAKFTAIDNLPTLEPGDSSFKEQIRDILGRDIERIIKYKTPRGGRYYIQIGNERHLLGGISTLYERRPFSHVWADITGQRLPAMDKSKWARLSQLLLAFCAQGEEVDLGAESSEIGQVTEWLDDYLRSHEPEMEKDRINDAVARGEPVVINGHVCIYLRSFKTWLKTILMVKLDETMVSVAIRAMGGESVPVYYRPKGKSRTSRGYWQLPERFAIEELEPLAENA